MRRLLVLVLTLLPVAPGPAHAAPEGQMIWALHFSLAPTLFEPAETPGVVSPFMILYALHDALVKPMPGKFMAPSLAESWSVSPDGLTYEFVLRKGVRFHNGDPVTAEDAKFSFERYRGVSAKILKEKVAAIETPDPGRIRFRLKQPWPDFMTFYATPATGASWVVPKAYVERVGEDGFKKAPVGAGPYRFVSSTPGIELVLEAVDGYWRKTPSVKRLVFKSVPDPATRLVMLKRRGTTGVCASPPRSRSTVRRSTRRRAWGSPRSPGASSPRASTSTGSPRSTPSIRREPGSSWRKPAILRASTAGTCGATHRSAPPPKRSSTTCKRPGYGRSFVRWSARRC